MNFLNPLLPQIQETAWESLLLGKAIWGKQGCILWLLINTNRPAQAQKLCRRKRSKRVGRRDERTEQLPGTSPFPHHAKNDWLLPQGTAAFVLQQFIPSWCQRHGQITNSAGPGRLRAGDIFAPIHQDWQGWNSTSFQLCFFSQDTNLTF